MDSERRVEFLKKLGELTMEFSIEICGCGCCGSPYLVDHAEKPKGGYLVNENDDNLRWVKV